MGCKAKVSVVIAVYGVEKYIEQCVRTLFGQTLKEIEYIFVDDCSPDRSVEIMQQVLEEFPERKEWVKLIRHEINQGVGAARNHGVAACTGEYVIHCDPDDWVELDMYEAMYNKAKETDADMVYCDYVAEMTDGICVYRIGGNSVSPIELQKEILRCDAGDFLWNKMYKRCIAGEDYSVICPDDITFYEDVLRNCCMLLRCETGRYLHEALYYYRIRRTSITRNPNKTQRESTFFVAVQLSKIMRSPSQIEALATRQRLGLLYLHSALDNLKQSHGIHYGRKQK